jgi:hypothetical protein
LAFFGFWMTSHVSFFSSDLISSTRGLSFWRWIFCVLHLAHQDPVLLFGERSNVLDVLRRDHLAVLGQHHLVSLGLVVLAQYEPVGSSFGESALVCGQVDRARRTKDDNIAQVRHFARQHLHW